MIRGALGAGFSKRALAFIVDIFALSLLFLAIFLLYLQITPNLTIGNIIRRHSYIIFLIFFFSTFFYFLLMTYFFGKTLGDAILNLKLMKTDDDGVITLKECFIRFSAGLLNMMTLFLYDIMHLALKQKKFLADEFSGVFLMDAGA